MARTSSECVMANGTSSLLRMTELSDWTLRVPTVVVWRGATKGPRGGGPMNVVGRARGSAGVWLAVWRWRLLSGFWRDGGRGVRAGARTLAWEAGCWDGTERLRRFAVRWLSWTRWMLFTVLSWSICIASSSPGGEIECCVGVGGGDWANCTDERLKNETIDGCTGMV